MKFKLSLVAAILSLVGSSLVTARDRNLPDVRFHDSEELYELLEARKAVRSFAGGSISDQVLAEILWAGHGLVYNGGRKTVHGTDAVSGATQNPRYTIATGSTSRVLRIYYLDSGGVYEYVPEEHKLFEVSEKDLRITASRVGRNAAGKIIIAVDTNLFRYDLIWAYLYAGSVTQNMYLAGTNNGISILTEGMFNGEGVFEEAGISDAVVPLIQLSIGN